MTASVNEQAATLKPCPFCGGNGVVNKTLHGRPVMKWVECNGCGSSSSAFNQVEHAIAAWNSRAPVEQAAPAVAVKVKPLEWGKTALITHDDWLSIRLARTPFGPYAVDKDGAGTFRVTLCGQTIANCRPATPDEGIVAAQADFERRILSALEPAAAPVAVTDEMVDRALLAWFGERGEGWHKHEVKDMRAAITAALSVRVDLNRNEPGEEADHDGRHASAGTLDLDGEEQRDRVAPAEGEALVDEREHGRQSSPTEGVRLDGSCPTNSIPTPSPLPGVVRDGYAGPAVDRLERGETDIDFSKVFPLPAETDGATEADIAGWTERLEANAAAAGEHFKAAVAAPLPAQPETVEDWRDDPSADDRWNAGLDYGMTHLCKVLGVDPGVVSWDAATETLDGDVMSVIGNILRAKYGDDWSPLPAQGKPSAVGKRHPLEAYADSYAQMSRHGDGKVDCRSVEVDIRQNMMPVTMAIPAAQEKPVAVVDEAMVERLVTMGWNACRKSLYAVCEDVGEEADRTRSAAKVGTAAEEKHSKGYHAGQHRAAKSIARGFNSMEARDDDNVQEAIRAALSAPSQTGGEA